MVYVFDCLVILFRIMGGFLVIAVESLDLKTREILLYGASFQIEKGSIYGLSGRNGSGKSTLLRTLSTLRSEKNGKIKVKDPNIKTQTDFKNELFYFESSDWYDLSLSGLDYLKLINKLWRNNPHIGIEDIIDYWELESFVSLPIKKYSLGMKQKLLLAMYAVSGASYLLFDEPTIGLDSESLNRFENFLLQLKGKNAAIFFSSHQNDTIYRICDVVYEIKDGSLIKINMPKEL